MLGICICYVVVEDGHNGGRTREEEQSDGRWWENGLCKCIYHLFWAPFLASSPPLKNQVFLISAHQPTRDFFFLERTTGSFQGAPADRSAFIRAPSYSSSFWEAHANTHHTNSLHVYSGCKRIFKNQHLCRVVHQLLSPKPKWWGD